MGTGSGKATRLVGIGKAIASLRVDTTDVQASHREHTTVPLITRHSLRCVHVECRGHCEVSLVIQKHPKLQLSVCDLFACSIMSLRDGRWPVNAFLYLL